jgi:hypothetical protein
MDQRWRRKSGSGRVGDIGGHFNIEVGEGMWVAFF